MMVKVDLQSATLTNAKGTTRTLPIIPLFSQDNSDFGGVTIPNDGNVVVVSTQVPAGNYAINAKAILVNQDDDDAGVAHCELEANGGQVDIQMPNKLDEQFEIGSEESFALQAVLKDFGGGRSR